MAPRTAKTKKAADVNVAPDVAPKKGRSKAKAVEEVQPETEEPEVIEKVATEKKSKRGKKAAENNGEGKTNGIGDEVPTKKGRKKKVPERAPKAEESDDINSEKDDSPAPEAEQEENVESNGHTEEAAEPSGKKKRGAKKEPAAMSEPKAGRGKKGVIQESVVTSQTENGDEEKAKPAAKGRGRKAQLKPEVTEDADEAKPEPATKGRKKAVKAKSPEPEAVEPAVDEEETPSEPEKKPAKGRKNQGKKAKAEDKPEEEPSTKKKNVNKKEEIGQGDTKDEDQEEVSVEEPKPKGKRGQKKAHEAVAETEEVEDTGEPNNKRERKPSDDKAPAVDKKKAPLKNKAETNYDEIDFTNTSTSPQGKEWNFKISSWNVDGIRAWMTKGGLEYVNYEKPDILCLQEVKCSKDKLPDECQNIPGYHAYWLCSDKDGYAGVGIYTTKLAMNVQYGLQNEELDTEGRIITAEYEHFYLICTYVPNAGRKLVTLPKRLQWNEEFRKHVKELDKKKPVIICGDMNVAHNEIDLANAKTNKKNAGFTVEERTGMTDLLGDGFVDTYRQLNPETTGAYTFWTYMMGSRAKNVGWRLDYFIVSERLLPVICDSLIRDKVYGSDHCPISLFLHLTTADKPKEESPTK